MSAIQSSTKWMNLNSCPASRNSRINIPTGVDKNNFIVIEITECGTKINCIYKYNITNDKWNKIDGFNNLENVSRFSSTLDAKQQIFLFHSNHITKIQLNNNNITHYNHDEINFPDISTSIIINDSLFIVGGFGNDSILKWNSENKTLSKFCDMYKKKFCAFGMIYNKNNHCLLLFGGYEWQWSTAFGRVDHILEFNMNTQQWNKLEVSLPQKISSICCTMAIRNQYTFLFGGCYGSNGYSDNIYIHSMKYKTLRQSKIKCPSKSNFEAITVNNHMKDEKIIFGYVRKQWKICKINNHLLPYYLMKLIHSYYLNEYVLLLDIKDKKLYKISTLDIV